MLQSSAPGLAARQLQPVEAAWLCWHRLWRIWPHILTVTHTAQAAPLFPIFITTTTKILFRTVVYKDLIIEKWKENSSKIWLHWKIPAVLQFNAAVLSSIFFSSFCISLWNISFYRKMHFFIFFLNMVIFFFPFPLHYLLAVISTNETSRLWQGKCKDILRQRNSNEGKNSIREEFLLAISCPWFFFFLIQTVIWWYYATASTY